jgi:hypothetical protein
MFSQIVFQDALIDRLNDIEWNGVGEHKRRSHAAAMRQARKELRRQGYTERQADEIVEQARDVWKLNRLCESE